MKYLFLLLATFLVMGHLSFAQTYHEDDKEGLRMFLRQPSAIAGEINAQRLGLQLSDTLNWQTHEEWVSKILRLQWNNESPKRLINIEWVGNFNDPKATNLSGNLNYDKWIYLEVVRCEMNQLTSFVVGNCPNLTLLVCSYNNITTLNVSNCPVLTTLWCDINQLTTTNIDYCPALEKLLVQKNALTTFEVSNCDILHRVDFSSNKFSTLDMSIIPTLSNFGCGNNLLTSINLSNNQALTSLDCGSNPLTTLDLSHNPLLNELYCSSNQLTSLDLTDNSSLSVLECINNPLTSLEVPASLRSLNCRFTSLSTLDLSHCTNLDNLDCRNSQLTSLNVNNCEALKNVNCQNNKLDTLDLSDCKNLSYVECYNNHLTSMRIDGNSNLRHMYCNENLLTDLDVSNCPSLGVLYCSNNLLKTLDITNCTSLVDLSCTNNNLNALNISTNKVLHALWCNDNQFYFSGLPPKLPVPWTYTYWPQKTIEGGKIHYEKGIDLSKEYIIEGNLTQFYWFDITGGDEQPVELHNELGFFSLSEEDIGKRLRCKMTNATFPMLTGNNILIYEVKIEDCQPVVDLVAEVVNHNSVRLDWSPPADSLAIEGYHIYRNNIRITAQLIRNHYYVDEKLYMGNYEYYVTAHYTNGCISDTSNHVKAEIEVGVKERGNPEEIVVWPNPTTGKLRVKSDGLQVTNVEVFDVYGRKQKIILHSQFSMLNSIDITQLPKGLYFLKITTEQGTITKKIIKY